MWKNSGPAWEGNPNAPLMFVAEAPSTHEMVQGRPLVGPAGKLFNELLRDAGGVRSDCSLTNVIPCKIKDITEYIRPNGKFTDKGTAAVQDFRARLIDARPNTVVAMGRLACAALTGDARVMKLRGSPLESTLLPGVEVIPTIHPAATLPFRRMTHHRFTIIADLRKALRHSEVPGVVRPKRSLLIEPTFAEAMAFLRSLLDTRTVAFDIEVYNHQVSCISFAADPAISMSIPFSHDYWTEDEEMAIWRAIADVLEDPHLEKVGQYVTFDVSFLISQNRIHTRGLVHDTYFAQKIMYPDFPASLEFQVSVYTDEPYYKDDRKLWRRLDKDVKRFWRYNAMDSAVTLECWHELRADLQTHPGFIRTYEMTQDVVEPCIYMMERGLKIDSEALERTKHEIAAEIAAKEAQLKEVSEHPFNPDSSKQCIAYFYGTKGIKPYLNRKTGRPTCDDKALARIIRRFNMPEARLVQELRGLKKLHGTYLDMRFDPDKRLRCFYNPRGTITGRLSSSQTVRETGLNMQNLHPAFKRFLVSDT